jgi:hypothetical protein
LRVKKAGPPYLVLSVQGGPIRFFAQYERKTRTNPGAYYLFTSGLSLMMMLPASLVVK